MRREHQSPERVADLFAEPITLNPCQSLALRRMLDAMKADDSLYTACPDVVRSALCDFLMPPYSSAELQVAALEAHNEDLFRLIDKFAHRIKSLEAAASARKAVA